MGRKPLVSKRSLVPVNVVQSYSYIDTVCLVLPARMPKDAFRDLRISLLGEQRRRKRYYVLRRVPTSDGFWIFKLYVHQPSVVAIRILNDAVDSIGASLLEVHCSLDMETDSAEEARTLQDYIEERLVPNKRNRKPVVRVVGTTYFNRQTRRGTEVAVYSDRNSKVSGNPCCHIDWRVIGLVALRKEGLVPISDLLGLNHREFWDRRLLLLKPPSAGKLARARVENARSKGARSVSFGDQETSARMLLRRVTNLRGVVVAQELLNLLRSHKAVYNNRPFRLFALEPHDWMLPPQGNAMWPR